MAVSPNTVTSADVQNFIIGGGGGDFTTGDGWDNGRITGDCTITFTNA